MSEEPTRAMPPAEQRPANAAPEQGAAPPPQGDEEKVQSIDQTGTQRRFLLIGGIGCVVLLCICVALGAAMFFIADADSDDDEVAEVTPETTPTATVEPTPTIEATPTLEPEATPTPEPTPTEVPEPTPEPTPTEVPEATPVPDPTPTPEPSGPAIAFGDGTFVINDDVAPGRYFANNPSDSCYWERLSGFSGDLDDINANDFGGGRKIVEISPDDVGFSTRDCGQWVRDDFPVRENPGADLVDGTYLVDEEVQPGTWRSEGSTGSCYWARLSGFSGELEHIITNNFGGVGDIVQIQPGDEGFESSNCGPWVRMGD